MACDAGLGSSVFEGCLCGQVVEVHVAVLQQSDVGVGCQTALAGEQIRAVTLGLDVGREGVDGVLRQEMVQVQLVDADVGIIGQPFWHHLSLGIQGDEGTAFHLHVAVAFVQGHIEIIACAVGFQSAVDAHAVGDAVCVAHLGVDQCQDEVQLLSLALYLDVCFHLVEVCHVVNRSVQRGVNGCGEVEVETCQFHVLHVAVDGASDVERMVGEVLHELLGQFACKFLDILLAQLSEEAHFHLPRVLVVEGVEIDICLCHDVRIGGLEGCQRQSDMVEGGVKCQSTRELIDHNAALFLEVCLAHEERDAVIGKPEGIDAEPEVS